MNKTKLMTLKLDLARRRVAPGEELKPAQLRKAWKDYGGFKPLRGKKPKKEQPLDPWRSF